MMLSTDDRCQVLSCTNGRFTFCPHCSSNVCMKCLNEHYILMENDYKTDIVKIHQEFDFERYNKIEQQKDRLNHLYENELKRQDEFEDFLQNNIDQNGQPIMNCFQPCKYQKLKKQLIGNNQQRIRFDRLTYKINELLDNFEQDTDLSNFNEIKIGLTDSSASSNLDSNEQDNAAIIIELDDDDLNSSSAIGESDTEEHQAEIDDETAKTSLTQYDWKDTNLQDSNITDSRVFYTNKKLKPLRFHCPFTKFKLGLNGSHFQLNGIRRIPCKQSVGRTCILYPHLRKCHLFNNWSALRIIRALVYASDHLDQLDLFSTVPLNILTETKSLFYFSSYCPLTKIGAFGLLPIHQVKLCQEDQRSPVKLHQHLINVHGISKLYATKLVKAMIEHKDHDTIIFPPMKSIIQQE